MYTISSESEAAAAIKSLEESGDSRDYPHPARMYGVGYWIKRRFGIPEFVPLDNWDIQHSPPMNNGIREREKALAIPFLLYNEEQKANYDGAGKTSIVVGSSFVHCKELEGISVSDSARGTLAFPAHSTIQVELRCDWDGYAESLLALPARYQPVEVCLYYREVLNGASRPFLRRGITVHCAGHHCDDAFPLNFYRILRNFRFSTSNSVGSFAYYSVDLGIPFFIFGPDVKLFNHGGDSGFVKDRETTFLSPETVDHQLIRREVDLFTYDLTHPVEITARIKEYVATRLGTRNRYREAEIRSRIWRRYLRLVVTAAPRAFLRILRRMPS